MSGGMRLSPDGDDIVTIGNPSSADLRLVILVSVHGNEQCGLDAVNRLLETGAFADIGRDAPCDKCDGCAGEAGCYGPYALAYSMYLSQQACEDVDLPAKDGSGKNEIHTLLESRACPCPCRMSLQIILGNPEAVRENKRFLKRNLNRIMLPERFSVGAGEEGGYAYEAGRARVIAAALGSADVVLDLHSCSAESPAFALPLGCPTSLLIALSMPIGYVIECLGHATREGGTSLDYVAMLNKADGPVRHCDAVTVECGQHTAPGIVDTTMDVILSFVFGPQSPVVVTQGHAAVHMRACESVQVGKVFHFSHPWRQFQVVAEGEEVCVNDGKSVTCPFPEGGVIIMPAQDPIEGEEAFFWGQIVPTE